MTPTRDDAPATSNTGTPWINSGPVALKSVPLSDIDDTDTTFQFRFSSDWKALESSLRAHGQLNPVKLVAGDAAFRIVDGHSRVRAIKKLGWNRVEAILYRGMTEREAKALSYQANVTRRNLSFAEKANAMQGALTDGFSRAEVATLFGVSKRTVDRHLELPQEMRRHIDGARVTMAHGRTLKPLVGTVPMDVLEDLLVWVGTTGASDKGLRQRMKNDGLLDRRGGRKTFGTVSRGAVHCYRFRMGPNSSSEDRDRAIAFFRRAIAALECLDTEGD